MSGAKTIGVATCDALRMLATPLTTVKRGKLAADLAALAELARKHEVKALAIGLPLNMDGSEGPRCQSVRQFAANIAAHGPPALAALPVVLQDERLSTAAVTRGMIDDYDMSRAKRAERVDAAAAAWILESALASLSARGLSATIRGSAARRRRPARTSKSISQWPATSNSSPSTRCRPSIAADHDARPGAHEVPRLGDLRRHRHQLARLVVSRADIDQQGERFADLDAHRLGPEGDHVVVGEHHPAGAAPEIERTRRERRRRRERQQKPDANCPSDLHRRFFWPSRS